MLSNPLNPSAANSVFQRTRFEFQRLNLSDFNLFNSTAGGTYIDTGGVVDLGPGLGWQVPLKGDTGTSVTDPFDGFHAISKNPIKDMFGRSLIVTDEWVSWVGFHTLVDATGTQNIDVMIGLCNQAADSGSMIALMDGIRLNNSQRRGGSLRVDNGSATIANGTTGLTTPMRFRNVYCKQAIGTGTASITKALNRYMGSDNIGVAAVGATSNTSSGLGFGDSNAYICFAVYRTATTDTTTRVYSWEPVFFPPINLKPKV